MRFDIKRRERKFLNNPFHIFAEDFVEINKLASNVFDSDNAAKIYFRPAEAAHMGYKSYAIDANASLEEVISDINAGITFSVRIEFNSGVIECDTDNLKAYYYLAPYEWDEKEVKALFDKLLN